MSDVTYKNQVLRSTELLVSTPYIQLLKLIETMPLRHNLFYKKIVIISRKIIAIFLDSIHPLLRTSRGILEQR